MDLVLDGIVKRVGPQVWLHGMDMALHWVHTRAAQAGLERLTQCVMAAARDWLDTGTDAKAANAAGKRDALW